MTDLDDAIKYSHEASLCADGKRLHLLNVAVHALCKHIYVTQSAAPSPPPVEPPPERKGQAECRTSLTGSHYFHRFDERRNGWACDCGAFQSKSAWQSGSPPAAQTLDAGSDVSATQKDDASGSGQSGSVAPSEPVHQEPSEAGKGEVSAYPGMPHYDDLDDIRAKAESGRWLQREDHGNAALWIAGYEAGKAAAEQAAEHDAERIEGLWALIPKDLPWCDECRGSGGIAAPCSKCRGVGRLFAPQCPLCHGGGRISDGRDSFGVECPTCGGSGKGAGQAEAPGGTKCETCGPFVPAQHVEPQLLVCVKCGQEQVAFPGTGKSPEGPAVLPSESPRQFSTGVEARKNRVSVKPDAAGPHQRCDRLVREGPRSYFCDKQSGHDGACGCLPAPALAGTADGDGARRSDLVRDYNALLIELSRRAAAAEAKVAAYEPVVRAAVAECAIGERTIDDSLALGNATEEAVDALPAEFRPATDANEPGGKR